MTSTHSVTNSHVSVDVSMTNAVGAQVLDLAAVLKASRALSGEIVLERLLTRLMNICVEAAGAQRGLFLAIQSDRLVIEAERDITTNAIRVLDNVSLSDRADLPQTLIRYVARTGERVVLGDAVNASSYQRDPAVVSRNLRSVLCQAITSQGKRVGILYLENNLAADTFTFERCELLESLGAQAAISIENARLYETLEQRVRDRTRALQESLRLVTESQQRLADELSEAATYVRSLLPDRLTPTTPNAPRTDWCFIPSASLGGDAFGYRWLGPDEDALAVYLLDVCGHGMASALLSISVLNSLQRDGLLGADFRDPGQVLSALNDAFPASRHNGLFFTIWYGVYEPKTRTLRFASAGHPRRPRQQQPHPSAAPGPQIDELCTPGPMIGIIPGLHYKTQSIQLSGPANLFVFSDGVYELSAPSGEVLDYDAFLSHLTQNLSAPPHNLARMIDFARAVRGGQPLEDDFSMLELVL